MFDRLRKKIGEIPEWLWTPAVAGALLLLSGGLGMLMGQPWLFPSLGPSAILHGHNPRNPAATFYNTVVGHFLGIGAGFGSVLVFRANLVPAVLSTEELTVPRLAAAVVATYLTVLLQLRLKVYHPPAAATTLLIALGAFKPGLRELQILVVGTLIVGATGEFFRRVRL